MATPPIRPEPTKLPEVLGLGNIASLFHMTRSGARRAVLRGEVGPYFRVGRRLFVRNESMLDAIRKRETNVTLHAPPPVPQAPEWAKTLLRRGRRASG